MTSLLPPNRHKILRQYMQDVIDWHGYVKLLGMPSLQPNPDVSIDELYVPQSVSQHYLSVDNEPNQADLINPAKLLLKHKRLVVLGDPGCGKSTLINYFSWYLSKGFSNPLPGDLAHLIPLPIVLRETPLGNVKCFADLFDAFMHHPVADKLKPMADELGEYIKQGKVLFLIDGLDEVNIEQRKKLAEVILQGFEQHPNCYFLATSRIVGYDDAPLRFASELATQDPLNDRPPHPLAPHLCYIAPFTQEQVSRFAYNWYLGHSSEAEQARKEFVSAINANSATKVLARTANLLTMMALIFKIRSKLPNGRALLYDDIAQAYLESIDSARKIGDAVPWRKKKNWLAKIGFEMQLRRQRFQQDEDEEEDEQELLIARADILDWLQQAMAQSGDCCDSDQAEQYLQWIIRRSGLLIPRGEDQFAFMHLSFQEYFAAFHIQNQMKNPAWLAPEEDEEDEEEKSLDSRVDKAQLAKWANNDIWQQTLIFLFEMYESEPGWANRLWKYCFKADDYQQQREVWEDEKNDLSLQAFIKLQLKLLVNPHLTVKASLTAKALQQLVELAVLQQQQLQQLQQQLLLIHISNENRLLVQLLTQAHIQTAVEQLLAANQAIQTLEILTLSEFEPQQRCHVYRVLNYTPKLQRLVLETNDLTPLTSIAAAQLPQLTEILIWGDITTISPIRHFTSLQKITAFHTKVTDFSPLAQLPHLTELIINNKNADVSGIDPAIIKCYDF